jgi:hypothetical protein
MHETIWIWLCNRLSRARWNLHVWWYWFWPGWPRRRRCPQCAGSGVYLSDVQARYDPPPHTKEDYPCDVCQTTGLAHRSRFWRSR